VAYIRKFLKKKVWQEEYVIEPIAQRLIDGGMDPKDIEDAYSISVSRRLAFQAWVQKYVDHGISSTINLPRWGSAKNNKQTIQKYGSLFLKHLPKLRGLTCYADGSRDGQPLTPITYEEALEHQATHKPSDVCKVTKGESCGD
jgi:ribonucleoside-diphosphate reductase alpha chain